jgi:hypothetical protein
MTTKNMLLIFIFFLLSCKEDDLPKPTQNGSGTFACKVDGKVYTPKSDDFKKSAKRAGLNGDVLGIAGVISAANHYEVVSFRLENFSGVGTYILDTENETFGNYRDKEDKVYKTNATYTGKVKITHFDQNKKIVSGTFDFKAQNAESKEVVHVSEGRFDLYYDEL